MSPFPKIVRSASLALFAIALWSGSAHPAAAAALTMNAPANYEAKTYTNPVSFSATLSGTSGATVNWMKIHVDALTLNATLSGGPNVLGTASGSLTLTNCREHTVYATAQVTDVITGVVHLFDSRNAPTANPAGEGITRRFIHNDIKVQGVTWLDRGTNTVYDSQGLKEYPSTQYPFHYKLNQNGTPAWGARPVVYLMGTAPKVQLDIWPISGSVPVEAFGEVELVGQSFANFSSRTAVAGNKATINFPTLDRKVGVVDVNMNWAFYVQFSDGTWVPAKTGIGAVTPTNLFIYSVLTFPQAPQARPYWGVLDNACRWAEGQTNPLDVAKKITTGLFFSGRFKYRLDGISGWTEADGTRYKLTAFLNTTGLQTGNCEDVSEYLLICQNAVGLSFTVAGFASDPEELFFTNPICLIGTNPIFDTSYLPVEWGWHQIAQCPSFTSVYDACAAHKEDYLGNGYRNPPINWPLTPYWQTKRYALPNPSLGLVFSPEPSVPTPVRAPFVPSVN